MVELTEVSAPAAGLSPAGWSETLRLQCVYGFTARGMSADFWNSRRAFRLAPCVREERCMTRRHWLLLLAGLVVGLLISGRFARTAQDRAETPQADGSHSTREKTTESALLPAPSGIAADPVLQPSTAPGNQVAVTLQDALLRPYHFPFSRPTSLAQVCAQLQETLKAPVVLDLSALDRKSAEPNDTVQLELSGVRLKTGLKLLLDQVGLTFRVVAEDNLMIITDQEGAEDPAERIWAELRVTSRPARRAGCRRRTCRLRRDRRRQRASGAPADHHRRDARERRRQTRDHS